MRQVLLGVSSKVGGDGRARAARLEFRRAARALCLAAFLVLARPPQILGQEFQFRVDAFPTGLKPLGVDVVTPDGEAGPVFVVVANSGEDSVSVFRVTNFSTTSSNPAIVYRLELPTTVRGIPAPYGVASCRLGTGTRGDRFFVTSPSDNSVTVIRVPDGRVLGKISIGPQPHAVACFSGSTGVFKGVVSNVGDDSLAVFDVNSLTVELRIPGVAGSRGLHGIGIY